MVDLLVRERSNGKTLRQLGQIFGISPERIRQLLAKHGQPQVTLLPEATVAAKLGYSVYWLAQLRKDGIINPVKSGARWLYSEEQVRQIPVLIAQMRRCERCGRPRPPHYPKFCRECSQHRKNHRYRFASPEEKAECVRRVLAWWQANPERWKEIQARARRNYRTKHASGTQPA